MTPSPRIQAQREPRSALVWASGGGERLESERDEIADFVDERAQLVARGLPGRLSQLLRPVLRSCASVQ